jgi:predicted acyltransferase (DUF342 family)
MKKYEFTGETIKASDCTLHRIKAVKSFGDVEEGDIGGWIESEDNLSHEGDCWVGGNAMVYENAQVYGDARVYGYAKVYGDALVYGTAQVSGDAQVYGKARVHDSAKITRDEHVQDSTQTPAMKTFKEIDMLWESYCNASTINLGNMEIQYNTCELDKHKVEILVGDKSIRLSKEEARLLAEKLTALTSDKEM